MEICGAKTFFIEKKFGLEDWKGRQNIINSITVLNIVSTFQEIHMNCINCAYP